MSESSDAPSSAESAALVRLLTATVTPGPSTSGRYGPEEDQTYDVYGSGANAPTVVYVHGGYFRPGTDRSHARAFAAALAAHGCRVVLAEYRRPPGDPDTTTEDVGLLDDHLRWTGSRRARELLDHWATAREKFVKVFPTEYKRALGEIHTKKQALAQTSQARAATKKEATPAK